MEIHASCALECQAPEIPSISSPISGISEIQMEAAPAFGHTRDFWSSLSYNSWEVKIISRKIRVEQRHTGCSRENKLSITSYSVISIE